MGASFVDYSEDSFTDGLRAPAPQGFAGIVDLVGGAALRAVAPLAVTPSAVVAVGDPSVTEIGGALVERHTDRNTLERVAALMLAGTLDPHITATPPLDAAAQALARVEDGHSTGKTVLDLSRWRPALSGRSWESPGWSRVQVERNLMGDGHEDRWTGDGAGLPRRQPLREMTNRPHALTVARGRDLG